jgi:hypothetical protein
MAHIPINGTLTGLQVARAYGIPYNDGAGIKIGIVAYGGGFLQSDTDKLFDDLRAAGLVPSGTVTPTINLVSLSGLDPTPDPTHPDFGETALDISCVASIVPGATITVYQGTPEDIFNRIVQDGVDIVTYSYAGNEGPTREDTEALYAKLTANKIAFCAASGDTGAELGGIFGVAYPSSSPQCISVGGTTLIIEDDIFAQNYGKINSETDSNGGGGGISSIFNLPSWQSGLTYTPITNNTIGSPTALTKRGIPDVSLAWNGYALYQNGILTSTGGTSASAPVFAGILARIQKLTGIKRSSAEYNAIFYAHPQMFRDITVGRNDLGPTKSGYLGTTSWDPVTGLGPPNGLTFLSYLYGPTEASLSGLTIDAVNLSPAFASGTKNYAATVSSSTTSISLTATATAAGSTITLNGASWNGSSAAVSLNIGTNVITIVVSSSDNSTSNTYTIIVTRQTLPPTYTTSNTASINEGAPFFAYLNTTNVSNGTPIYWSIKHLTTTSADFLNQSGTVTITNNTCHATLIVKADNLTEGSERFQVEFRTGSQTGVLVATSGEITINDTSVNPITYSYSSTPTSINEGESGTFNIATTSLPDNTTLYWTVDHITTSDNDFSSINGSFIVNSNIGNFTINPLADQQTEGPETFTVSVRTGSATGTAVLTSGAITINDTSIATSYTLTTTPSPIDEGKIAIFNVATTNIENNTILYWRINNIDTSDLDFDSISGSFVINSGTGSFSISVASDRLLEGPELFTVSIKTNSTLGRTVLTSNVIKINDIFVASEATTITGWYLTANKSSVNEGSSVIFTLDGTNLPNGSLVPFTISGTNINTLDFLGLASLSGNFVIQNGKGRVVINAAEDFKTEGPETFVLSLDGRSESIGVVLNDTALTPPGQLAEFYVTASAASVDEGSSVTFITTGINVPAGTTVPYEIYGIQKEDLVSGDVVGTMFFAANTAYDTRALVTLSLLEDFKTEGNENIVLILKPSFAYTLKVSSSITAVDTSRNNKAKIIIVPSPLKVIEGNPVTFTASMTNVNAGEILDWAIYPAGQDGGFISESQPASDITISDFEGLTSLTGKTPAVVEGVGGSNTTTITFVTRDDYSFEQTEYFSLVISRGTDSGTSPVVQIQDSGHTLLTSDAMYSGNVIVSFLDQAKLEANIGGLVTEPGYWKNTKGQLSDQFKIQGRRLFENEDAEVYYQPFSYVIKTSQSIDVWREAVKNVLHPAGFSFFSEINNETTDLNMNYAGVKAVEDSEINVYTPITADRISRTTDVSATGITTDLIKSVTNIFTL